MRYGIISAALCILISVAAWSWRDSDGLVVSPLYHTERERQGQEVLVMRQAPKGALDGDVARLMRLAADLRDRRDIWSAGLSVVELPVDIQQRLSGSSEGRTASQDNHSQEAVGETFTAILNRATAYYSVEWAREALIEVRWCESTNRLKPCVVGSSGERGPFQFMASTWASTPYADLAPCNLETATWAAAWMVSEGRWLEWTCWPR